MSGPGHPPGSRSWRPWRWGSAESRQVTPGEAADSNPASQNLQRCDNRTAALDCGRWWCHVVGIRAHLTAAAMQVSELEFATGCQSMPHVGLATFRNAFAVSQSHLRRGLLFRPSMGVSAMAWTGISRDGSQRAC